MCLWYRWSLYLTIKNGLKTHFLWKTQKLTFWRFLSILDLIDSILVWTLKKLIPNQKSDFVFFGANGISFGHKIVILSICSLASTFFNKNISILNRFLFKMKQIYKYHENKLILKLLIFSQKEIFSKFEPIFGGKFNYGKRKKDSTD